MNRWRRISSTYWMCFNFDVWKEHGVWRASFRIGPRYDSAFKTAEAAMFHCNSIKENPL